MKKVLFILLVGVLIMPFSLKSQTYSGAYSVGTPASYFLTIQEAIDSLTVHGVSGPVNIEFPPGTYTVGAYFLGPIPGASETNTVTIGSSTDNPADVRLERDLSGPQIFYLNNIAYVSFEGLTFAGTKDPIDENIIYVNSSSNINFNNYCQIESYGAFYFNNSSSIQVSNGSNVGEIVFWFSNQLVISHCILADEDLIMQSCSGVLMEHTEALYFSLDAICDATIAYCTSTLETSIINATAGCEELLLLGNNLKGLKSHGSLTLINNMITYGGSDALDASGIGVSNDTLVLFNNTVFYDGPNSAALNVFDLYSIHVTAFNNNFVSNKALVKCINGVGGATIESDYNNLYKPTGTALISMNGNAFANLIDWSTTSNDMHSVSSLPTFVSSTDLHIVSGLPENVGTPIAEVTIDIDGESRDALNPDIGADEFGEGAICGTQLVATCSDSIVCSGDTILLVGLGATYYEWTNNISAETFIGSELALPITASTTFYLKGNIDGGCFGYDSVTVLVNTLPTAIASPETVTLCPGESVAVDGTGGSEYSWSPAEFFDNPTASNPTLTLPFSGEVTLTVTDTVGCSSTDLIEVDLVCQKPQNIQFTSITSTSALVTWENGCDDPTLSFILQYKPAGAPSYTTIPGISGAATSYLLAGLPDNTKISVRLSAKCINGQKSPYTKAKTFKTLPLREAGILSVVSVYPSPTHDVINVTYTDGPYSVIIQTTDGREVFSSKNNINTIRISLRDLPSGIYFVKVQSLSGATVEQIIKS